MLGAFALAISANTPALAQDEGDRDMTFDQFYVGALLGGSFFQDADYDQGGGSTFVDQGESGLVFDGLVGARVYGPVWAELDIGYRAADVNEYTNPAGFTLTEDAEVSIFSAMFNAWVEIPVDESNTFVPYVGGGIGLAQLEYDYGSAGSFPNVSADDNGFAWQLGGGAMVQVSEGVFLVGRYTYFQVPSVDLDSLPVPAEYEHGSHNISGGVLIMLN